MLPKYLQDAEERVKNFLTNNTVLAMARPLTAGLMGAQDDAGEDDNDDDENLLDGNNIFDGAEEEVDSDDNDE
jgi:hypothetical protein